jgi:hypothetical protein
MKPHETLLMKRRLPKQSTLCTVMVGVSAYAKFLRATTKCVTVKKETQRKSSRDEKNMTL